MKNMPSISSVPLLLTILIVLGIGSHLCSAASGDSEFVASIRNITHILKAGGSPKDVNEKFDFQMFCRLGEAKNVFYYFRTATLRIFSSAEDIKLIKGFSPKDVYLQYSGSTKWLLWISNVLPWRARDTNFPTFNTSCVGISTSRPYSAQMIVRPVDPWKVIILVAGISLFFLAPKLSKSTLFFYSSGTLVGALAAALVLLFIVQRFLPKNKSGYFLMSVLWTFAFYFAGETWKRFEELLHERLPYIVAYLACGALAAFLACYRWGPPAHPKTLNIIQWSLQIGGLVLVHFSSDLVELSTAIILLLVIYYNTYSYLKYHAEKYYRRWFPPKPKLLTEEEYILQGAIETQKSLEELRSFVASPDSKPWKLVSRLKDPKRFSGFVEGISHHLSDEEILAYESDDNEEYNIPSALPAPLMSPQLNITNGLRSRNTSARPVDLLTDDEEEDVELIDNSLETDDED